MREARPTRSRPLRVSRVMAATAVALAGAGALAASASAATRSTSLTTLTAAPAGQTTTGGLLDAADSAFSGGPVGWLPYGGAAVSVVSDVGDTALGALAVTSAGGYTGAASPYFGVQPGARYRAAGWALASGAGHSVSFALRFYDAAGSVIGAGTEVGDAVTDSTTAWTQTVPVIGIAPAGAVTAQAVFVDVDSAAGELNYLDDVTLTQTTGVAAPLAAPLHTSGPHLLDRYGRQVTLHGINLDGLEHSPTANVTTAEVTAAQQWGANFVRIPLAEQYALPNSCGWDQNAYLSAVDTLVDAATSRGMLVLLDLHTNTPSGCATPVQQVMPDSQATTFWHTLANRYKANPLVAFDLYNEPHNVSDVVWRNGGTVTSGGVTYQTPGLQALYRTIRATGATNLVFASGNNWATSYPADYPLTKTSNLIYAAHAYTCPAGLPSTGATCNPGPGGIDDPSTLLNNWNTAGQTWPVMVTEFGFPDKWDGTYIANLTQSVTSRGWVGWDVFAFDGTNSGMFDLVKDAGPLYDPSPAGMAAVNAMLGD